jgi:hypothetical protein
MFSDTSSAPKIVDELAPRTETVKAMLGWGGLDGYSVSTRIITTNQYRLVGLTESAATGAAGTSSDTVSTTTRTAKRTNEANMWHLQVTRDSWTDWSTDTFAWDT